MVVTESRRAEPDRLTHPWEQHAVAVERLVASYAAIPAGSPVRLQKATSNLFRNRTPVLSPGLDTSGLTGVIAVDPVARTADVQGMCTYETLVDATLPHGLMPLVVPQLRTITLGGAVTGLGIESTSFRNGLPHESVLEMDVLTGAGELITVRPSTPADTDTDHADLFSAFPNSYGTLGYATRLRIELEPVRPYVALRNVRFPTANAAVVAIETIISEREWDGETVDFLDGVVLDADDVVLVLGRHADRPDGGPHSRAGTSDYVKDVYWRSLTARERDALSTYDYLWRWDADWFWCSRAFGVQHPVVRRAWPARWRRSDVYHRLVRLEQRHEITARIADLRGRGPRERVIQDVEIPLDATPGFLRWFAANVALSPVWLCPLRLREPAGPGSASTWPLYPLRPGETYVNVGFWGTVPITDGRRNGDVNRAVEQAVMDAGGHKGLYSDVYYDRDTFETLYGGAAYAGVKQRYDPDHRLRGLYDKAVQRS